jgi:N-methylhydantoinase A/oxoprolinase/acetone carboxylase beta subunit
MAERTRFTIQLDTGGTFTDGYVSSGERAVRSKVDTTPHDLTEGILGCVDRAASLLGLDRGGLLRQADVVRLSTTIGTNVLINRNGAKVGVLIGEGLYDRVVPRLPEALPVTKPLVERLPPAQDPGVEGATVTALRRLLERGARILVVALEDGPDLAARERAVRAFIASEYPRHYLGAVPVVPSHEVTLAPDSFIRVCTAVLDAYLHPVMSRFLYRVEDELRKNGYARPLLVAQSNGGVSRVAKTTAIRTWGSGPAGGVAAAAALARELELESVVAIDVGGTSSDLAVISQARWRYAVQPTIEQVPVSLPVLELASIGIGGGSIAAVSAGGLTVGPRSAGAQPGPAAFGLGGTDATLTDAACVLGLLDPENFLGGRKRLDLEAARRAVAEKLAEPVGSSVESAAQRVLREAADVLAVEVRRALAARGHDAHETWLFATGGAGGLLAARVAAEAGLAGYVAFPLSPVFSAFGLSRLDLLHTYEARPDAAILERLEALATRALRDMRGEGAAVAAVALSLEAEVADHAGRVAAVDLGDAADLGAALDRAKARADAVRLFRLKATVPGLRVPLPRRGGGPLEPCGKRSVVWDATARQTPVYDWDSLPSGGTLRGPAIVESGDTTVPIPPRARVEVGARGEIRVTRGRR